MQVQRVQNYNHKPQFNGTLTIIKQEGCKSINLCVKSIRKNYDKKLYNMFVQLLGEDPEKWSSCAGSTQSKIELPEFIKLVNKLLKTNISMTPKDDREPLFYHYTTDGKGNITYILGFINDPYTVRHSYNRGKKYIVNG